MALKIISPPPGDPTRGAVLVPVCTTVHTCATEHHMATGPLWATTRSLVQHGQADLANSRVPRESHSLPPWGRYWQACQQDDPSTTGCLHLASAKTSVPSREPQEPCPPRAVATTACGPVAFLY